MIKRLIFKLLKEIIPSWSSAKVYFGPLKGSRWFYSSGYSQYWMGTYESEISESFVRYSRKSRIVYDLGSNIGYYTLIASKNVIPKGHVYAFEPFPPNISVLKKHLDINRIENVSIIEAAVTDHNGFARMSDSNNNVANSICENSPMLLDTAGITVKTVTLDELVNTGSILPPDLIKIDVEGSEYNVLQGASGILGKFKPVVFLSTHNCQNEGVHTMCCNYLEGHGYSFRYFNIHKRCTDADDPWYDIIAESSSKNLK